MNQFTPLRDRFEASYVPEPMSGCWLWTGAASGKTDARPTIRVAGRICRAYRVAYELFVAPIPADAFVCHKCDTPLCVNPDHLYIGNAQTNAADAVARHRTPTHRDPDRWREIGRRLGSRNTWSRGRERKSIIPHADVPQLRARLAAGETLRAVGATYGVSGQAVWRFVARAAARAVLARADAGQEAQR